MASGEFFTDHLSWLLRRYGISFGHLLQRKLFLNRLVDLNSLGGVRSVLVCAKYSVQWDCLIKLVVEQVRFSYTLTKCG